eukprot:Skav210035  [mRNA]  locus=scaffold706:86070:86411:- [translate_table: standard]
MAQHMAEMPPPKDCAQVAGPQVGPMGQAGDTTGGLTVARDATVAYIEQLLELQETEPPKPMPNQKSFFVAPTAKPKSKEIAARGGRLEMRSSSACRTPAESPTENDTAPGTIS